MTKVLIADDEALLRDGIRAILEGEDGIEIVGEASDGDEAIHLARTLVPDVVLMDVMMPRVDGIDATRRIIRDRPDIRVIMLTTFDRDEYVYEALLAGASGFLLKDLRRRDLVNAIQDATDGNTLLAPSVTRRLVEQFFRPAATDAKRDEELGHLTSREIEVLTLVGKGLKNAEIGERLYLGENTVKTHVARIMSKLGLRDRVQAVIVAYETGLVRPHDDDG